MKAPTAPTAPTASSAAGANVPQGWLGHQALVGGAALWRRQGIGAIVALEVEQVIEGVVKLPFAAGKSALGGLAGALRPGARRC